MPLAWFSFSLAKKHTRFFLRKKIKRVFFSYKFCLYLEILICRVYDKLHLKSVLFV
ncbi:conserved protein of unknown function [Desulfovibrio sp. 86]|nr:conserved protein of unknown function [Desulfovibrio sp. 86]